MANFTIRQAQESDTALLLEFIRALARYEEMEHEVQATEEDLRQAMFVRGRAHALIAEEVGQPVGFALYFYNFSTFLGHEGLYLEDLFIRPEHRKKGYGKALFEALATIAYGYEKLGDTQTAQQYIDVLKLNYPNLVKADGSVNLRAARSEGSWINRATLGILGREAQTSNSMDQEQEMQTTEKRSLTNRLSFGLLDRPESQSNIPAPKAENESKANAE